MDCNIICKKRDLSSITRCDTSLIGFRYQSDNDPMGSKQWLSKSLFHKVLCWWSVSFLFIFQNNGIRRFKKNNIAILVVLVHRSGLRGHQILRSPHPPFSTLVLSPDITLPPPPLLNLVRSHERQRPPVKVAENLTCMHYVSSLFVACCAGRCSP